ncbi:rhombosortase [Vibrio sp. TH_r3]|uniref:rhombosortase n=1 Tax=Vibrio sp. TH_r3 TaxID=3082084 RepID=UPI00295434B6|nr:rhombosortase [Vibrio sp. TH_r3]MDV7104010.1 rhombosortase [Vibrio sp. TH_r3]
MKLSYFVIVVSAICTIFQLPLIQSAVIWNSDLIHSGQWWRILSGNLTHTNVAHLIMNTLALWLLCCLFKPSYQKFLVVLICLSLLVGTGLLMTTLQIYAGLSGVLHGMFVYFTLCEIINRRKSSWLLLVAIAVKVAYEQIYGASISTAELINARVAIEAHLIGLVAGFFLAMITFYKTYLRFKK